MTVGAILLHIMLFNNVSAPVRHLHRIYDEYTEALTYSEGFFEMIENDQFLPKTGGITSNDLQGNFAFENVDFIYNITMLFMHIVSRILRKGAFY